MKSALHLLSHSLVHLLALFYRTVSVRSSLLTNTLKLFSFFFFSVFIDRHLPLLPLFVFNRSFPLGLQIQHSNKSSVLQGIPVNPRTRKDEVGKITA